MNREPTRYQRQIAAINAATRETYAILYGTLLSTLPIMLIPTAIWGAPGFVAGGIGAGLWVIVSIVLSGRRFHRRLNEAERL